MFRRSFVLATMLLTASLQMSAQSQEGFNEARHLYEKGLYSQAAEIFSHLKGQEAAGYAVLCKVSLQSPDYQEDIDKYELQYPSSGLIPLINYKHGLNLFDQREYAKALPLLGGLNPDLLDEKQRSEQAFKKAYSYYATGDGEAALHEIDILNRLPRTDYNAAGACLAGYILYEKGRYTRAEERFLESRKDGRFQELSDYYLADCHFRRKDYKYLTKNAETLFAQASDERKTHIARMISESFLVSGNTEKAREYYSKVNRASANMDRNDWFYEGSLMFASGNYEAAIGDFGMMKDRTDSLGQIAEYQMAYSYIQTGNKVEALNRFNAASALAYDPVIKEDAFFNAAKLSFDLNHDASVFNSYIDAYPGKKKSEMIYDYIALAALYDKDYAAAVEAYDNIEELNQDQRNNYMKANYLRANQLIGGNAWRDAVPYLKAASFYASRRSALYQLSRYWMAEAAFREGDMAEARGIFTDLYNISALDNCQEGKALPYNIAYTYLREEIPGKAKSWFSTYLNSGDKAMRRDALIRKGDCDYVQKNYKDAVKSYHAAVSEFGAGDDAYALYQEALSHGLSGNGKEKVATLEKAKNIPANVPYRDESVYELARTYVGMGRNADAVSCYKDLVAKSADTTIISRSLLGLGMVASNEKKYDDAAGYYKTVVSRLPESQYTDDALMALESVYQAMGRSEEYVAYLESLGPKGSRSDADKERILFSGAEQTFLSGNYAKALSSLLSFAERYPGSDKMGAVNYYIANCHNRMDNKDKAEDAYNKVLADGNSEFREQASLELGRMLYGMERFDAAYTAFETLGKVAGFEENRHTSRIGMMESAYRARRYDNCIAAADLVLSDKESSTEEEIEAKYLKAKSLQQTGRRADAFVLYKDLSALPSSLYGAEACYLIIQDAYDSAKYKEVEDLTRQFASVSSQVYYVAKAFIVLGDSFADREEYAQAKATFQSIYDGYSPSSADDDIMDAVKMRLERLSELENE